MAIPAKAEALTTLGPTAPPAVFNVVSGTPQTHFNTAAPPGTQLIAPANGIITRFRTAADQTVTLRIIRKSGANYVGAGTGPQVPPLGTGIQVTTETHMPIAAGDTIGMDLPGGTAIGGMASGWTLTFFDAPFPDGGPPQAGADISGDFAYVSADFELDCDKDGLGDETQDSDLSSCHPATAPVQPVVKKKKCKKKKHKRYAESAKKKKCKKKK